MPVIRLRHCAQCGTPCPPNAACSRCGYAHGRARHKANGYTTTAWRKLSTLAIAAHPWCVQCGSRSSLTGDHLRYPALTLADVRVLCRSCNGRDGAMRQQGKGGGSIETRADADPSPFLGKTSLRGQV
jgi:hypothetical protein